MRPILLVVLLCGCVAAPGAEDVTTGDPPEPSVEVFEGKINLSYCPAATGCIVKSTNGTDSFFATRKDCSSPCPVAIRVEWVPASPGAEELEFGLSARDGERLEQVFAIKGSSPIVVEQDLDPETRYGAFVRAAPGSAPVANQDVRIEVRGAIRSGSSN